MNKAFLLIGGNLGNRKLNLAKARSLIHQRCGNIIKSSSLYETAAWGEIVQPGFLNQVLVIQTSLSATLLLRCMLNTEHKMGRVRRQKSGPRTIDIDLLFFNDEIIKNPGLEVPHPRLHLRKFVLEPLNEIVPGYIHPVFKITISQLLSECQDKLPVQKL